MEIPLISGEKSGPLWTMVDHLKIVASRDDYENDFRLFLKDGWSSIDSAAYQSCWAIDAVCDHLEAVTLGHIPRLLINIPPRPIADDAWVLTGRGLVLLKEVIVGDEVWTHNSRFRKVTHIHHQGQLECLRLVTRTGRQLDAEATHPFLTPDGWECLGKLQADDVVGLPPCYLECGVGTISTYEARLLGYLVGDGSCRGTPNVTAGDDGVAADVLACAALSGFRANEQKYQITKTGHWLRRISLASANPTASRRKGEYGPVRRWLIKHDLWMQNSYTKQIPRAVMQGSNAVVRAFIGAYWSCDGEVSVRGAKRDGVARDDLRIACSSVNRKFLSDLQVLLWRIGINSRLNQRVQYIKTKKQGDKYLYYELELRSQDDAWRFAQLIDIKHRRADRIEQARRRRFDFNRQMWGDSVQGLSPVGRKNCICLTVEEDQSFTANGFAVHNCAKTNTASIAWNAWIWARSQRTFLSGPQVKFLSGSYNAQLSLMASNKTRRMLLSPWYQRYWGSRYSLRLDQNTKTQFDNTMGGSRLATSVQGSLLGLGGDVICIDDPHNTETEKKIESDADRRKVASWWQEISTTRLNDPKRSVIVAVMQRLHFGDLSGVILKGMEEDEEEWVHLCIPMEFDQRRKYWTVILPQFDYGGDEPTPWTDPRGAEATAQGHDEQLMWPERFGPKQIEQNRIRLGPYMYAGRYQQFPIPKGGGIIKRDWWKLWDHEIAIRYGLEWSKNRKEFPPCDLVCASLDTAMGEKDENNFNALTVWGVWIDHNKNRRAMLQYAWAKRLPLHGKMISALPGETKIAFEDRQKKEWGLVEWVADTCRRYHVQRLLIENKTRGHDVAGEINRLYARESWGVWMVDPAGDKVSRTHSVVSMFTDDMVWAPETKWSDAVLDNCANFPKDEYDDLHDTVTQFLNWARENGILIRADEMSASLEEEARYKGPPHDTVANMYGV